MDPLSLTLCLQDETDERVQLAPVALKASAWMDLNACQAKGEAVDAKNTRRHANAVMRPSQLLASDARLPLAARIGDDLNRFLDGLAADRSIDPKSLKLNNTVAEIVQRIAQAYELKRAGARRS